MILPFFSGRDTFRLQLGFPGCLDRVLDAVWEVLHAADGQTALPAAGAREVLIGEMGGGGGGAGPRTLHSCSRSRPTKYETLGSPQKMI